MKKIVSIIVLALVAFSCERNTDTLGPALTDLYGPFQVFEEFKASTNSVDFQSGESVEFTCTFSKQVNWEIHIVGTKSGAEKVLSGFSRTIDANNGGLWRGSITNLPMFKIEDCMAYISVNAVDTSFSDTLAVNISIAGTRQVDGYVVTDFEDGLNPGFVRFVQSGADMRFDTVIDPTGAQGDVFYEMSGNVTFADDLGNIAMPKSSFTDTNFTLSTNDEIVYFNVFARKGPSAVQDIFVIQFMEDDNGNGTFDPGADDLHEFVFQGLAEDWGQYSIKYADLTTTNSNGGGVKNPDRLIRLLVLPIGVKQPFEGFLDYLIFTENGPLVP